MGEDAGLEVTVFDEARLREEGMHAILAVSQGSEEEARFIIMEHKGGAEGEAPLVLVGKGLSFDAGGISLKPPSGMEDMKFDMSRWRGGHRCDAGDRASGPEGERHRHRAGVGESAVGHRDKAG